MVSTDRTKQTKQTHRHRHTNTDTHTHTHTHTHTDRRDGLTLPQFGKRKSRDLSLETFSVKPLSSIFFSTFSLLWAWRASLALHATKPEAIMIRAKPTKIQKKEGGGGGAHKTAIHRDLNNKTLQHINKTNPKAHTHTDKCELACQHQEPATHCP